MISPEYIVQARGLSKNYNGLAAVRGIDLNIPRGGCFGLLGPNGAGKTTTLRMILGQCHMSDGTLEVLNMPMPASTRAVRARLGVVPQEDNLDPDFTVLENLLVYASYFGLRREQVMPRIEHLLQMIELQERANTPINNLSGGMKRRLSIARALINDPEVLVLDEPTTGLDPQVRHLIWSRLRQLKTSGKTLILTTHYMEEAERLCDQLAIIDHGMIIQQGPTRALIRENVEPDVIEIHADAARVRELFRGVKDYRIEEVGEATYCYLRDARRCMELLEGQSALSFLHRPANLEDIFLKFTGRDLRD